MNGNNQNYGRIAAEVGTYAAIGVAVNVLQNVAMWAMQPDVLTEEKEYLKENFEILRKNFTK